ncbi:DUF1934 domain-containing protein [Salinibacillus xinjiangensis]|uniref:DUF1934 family protein n=1 Tax=Salinibacillus xinjiangensis TaxID=1229268 RepID=A0A6G1X5N6_9BACI|nr:DUF1934 domain-containing protein [Salinibacillus xinjiangensis]MRG86239.1 DUF1934 family protein [Salinibacillus xinjiangensis]
MNVKVTLKTEITDQSFREQMDVVEKGEFYDNDDTHVLIFNEHDEDGNAIRNMITISQDKVVVKRKGKVKMNQIFREDRITESTYYHPYGTMRMETETKDIEFSEPVKGLLGQVDISYLLSINEQEPQSHRLTLTYERE